MKTVGKRADGASQPLREIETFCAPRPIPYWKTPTGRSPRTDLVTLKAAAIDVVEVVPKSALCKLTTVATKTLKVIWSAVGMVAETKPKAVQVNTQTAPSTRPIFHSRSPLRWCCFGTHFRDGKPVYQYWEDSDGNGREWGVPRFSTFVLGGWKKK